MAKHPRKRQKTKAVKEAKAIQPLGSNLLTNDASKDDEERRLESMLFGTKFIPREDKNELALIANDESEMQGGGQEMNNLTDADLFFIDDLALPGSQAELSQDVESSKETDGTEGPESADSDSDAESSSSQPQPSPQNPLLRPRKRPAWTDPSDPPSVSLSATRLRKLRDAPSETSLSGREYETRLRRQFERINPEPSWAANARKVQRALVDDENDDSVGIHELTSSTSGILAPSRRKSKTSIILPSGTIAIERLRDANQAAQSSGSGGVKVVAFHPSERVPVLCVGTADRRIRLFNIDGHTSPLLQTLHIPSLPLTSQNSATFHPLGSSLLLTGPRPFFFTHDLQTGVTAKHARGLWGTTFNSVNDPTPGGTRKRGRHTGDGDPKGVRAEGGGSMEITAFSPHTGDILAVAGRGGYVHLVDWKSGAGQVVGSLKCGGGGGGVRALWWTPDSNSPSGEVLGAAADGGGRQHLAVLSGDAEVYIWDVGERRCVRRWKDEGGFRGAGRVMAGCAGGGGGGWLAVGSNTGFVNVYGNDSFAPPPLATTTFSTIEFGSTSKPLKTIANLTTAISTLKFNHDAQMLAVASQEKKDAMRLIHLPSLTSFANWPTSSTPLGHITAVDFSARSEYVAIGNTRGRVLLYHLRDYGAG